MSNALPTRKGLEDKGAGQTMGTGMGMGVAGGSGKWKVERGPKDSEERVQRLFPGLDLLLSANHRHWLRIPTRRENHIIYRYPYQVLSPYTLNYLMVVRLAITLTTFTYDYSHIEHHIVIKFTLQQSQLECEGLRHTKIGNNTWPEPCLHYLCHYCIQRN